MSLRLEHWLVLAFFGLTTLFVGGVSLGFYAQFKEALLDRTENQLLSINILKERLLKRYLHNALESTDSVPISDDVESIVTERSGMGTTGESYLVDSLGNMMTVSRFFPATHSGGIKVDTEGFRAAQAGGSGTATYRDYRGILVIGAYRPIAQDGLGWVLLTEIDYEEALRPIHALRNRFLALSLILLIISGAISIGLAIALARPIDALRKSIHTLARGQLPAEQPPVSRITEINDSIRSLNELIDTRRRAVSFAQQIGRGDFETHHSVDEEDQLGTALMSMRDQLVALNQQQWQLERETKRLLIDEQEADRERIARDIHDSIGPMLTTAKLKVLSAPLTEATAQEVKALLDEAIAEVRRVASNLMPAVLRDFGPGKAIHQLVRDVKHNSDIEISYVNDLSSESRLTKDVGIALYRIAQEAITNTLRHAQASEIVISLTEFDDQVTFFFRDNGVGFRQEQAASYDGRGLQNIRERIHTLNGAVRMYNEHGAVIEAEIPL